MTFALNHQYQWESSPVDLPFLNERERTVIGLRLGLDRGVPRSRSAVARLAHLDASLVRRVEAVAACKLRHPSASAFEPQVSQLLSAIERLP